MHPSIVQDHPGDCPICGMKLVKVASAGAAGGQKSAPVTEQREQKEQWQCPMHPSIVQDHPGDCPICGMKLVKVEGTGGSAGGDAGAPAPEGLSEVTIDAGRQQLIGLKIAHAERGADRRLVADERAGRDRRDPRASREREVLRVHGARPRRLHRPAREEGGAALLDLQPRAPRRAGGVRPRAQDPEVARPGGRDGRGWRRARRRRAPQARAVGRAALGDRRASSAPARRRGPSRSTRPPRASSRRRTSSRGCG